MPKTVDFYFTVLSSYAYLAAPRVAEVRDRSGATFVFRPVDIMKVFAATDTTPPAQQPPARQKYRAADLARIAKAHDMPMNIPPAHWPVPQDAASGMIIAAQANGVDPMPLTQAIMRGVWVDDANIADADTLIRIATDCGFDGVALLAQATASDAQAAFDANTARAVADGVFGSPSFVVNGEVFWGQDRLGYLEAAL